VKGRCAFAGITRLVEEAGRKSNGRVMDVELFSDPALQKKTVLVQGVLVYLPLL
jgi:hypothetical protein